MTGPAHAVPNHTCPYCLKVFATRDGLRAHQKRKRHRVSDRHEYARLEKDMRTYDAERRKQEAKR